MVIDHDVMGRRQWESGLLRTLPQPAVVGSTNRTHEAGSSGTSHWRRSNQRRRLSQPLQPSGPDNFRTCTAAAELDLLLLQPSANRDHRPRPAPTNAVAQHSHDYVLLPERPKPIVISERRITNPAELVIRPISPSSSFTIVASSRNTPSLSRGSGSSRGGGGSSGRITPPPSPNSKGSNIVTVNETNTQEKKHEKACKVYWRGYW
ncbi:hypothetical protein F4821DRAFT_276156 [Hypoxylon rubiginosum]|uniref:Uncharacterized protein n=1 Tax=Hypoxylon rubiginosum TaxID=110542 RepID=A0ACC0D9B0_9PEZI|nr:hypothetical protein F4821DRAFT_276156 [Hypoxylon rubiginosum]